MPEVSRNTDNTDLTPESIASRTSAEVDSLRDELLAATTRIIQFRTVSGGTEEQQAEYEREIPACFEWLGAMASQMGFGFRVIDGVVGEISWPCATPGAPVVAVSSHIDVVTPVGDWTHPPFAGEIADGFLWGRGIIDDKGPLLQALYGLYAAKRAGITLPCTVNLVVGTQEETSDWSDLDRYLEVAGKPDYGFTPDAEFPIINGEKGMATLVLEADWDAPPMDAETGLEFVSLVGGTRENIVPDRCELMFRFPKAEKQPVMKELVRSATQYVVESNPEANVTLTRERDVEGEPGRYEAVLTFIGKAAHSSLPEEGRNAILYGVDFIKNLEALPEGTRNFATFLLIACKDLHGENIGIDVTHDFIGRTTVSLSLLEIQAQRGKAVVNTRPTMGVLSSEVLDRMSAACAEFARVTGLGINVTLKPEHREAIFLDHEDPAVAPFIKALQRGFELVTGKEPKLVSIGGTTYAKAMPNCCAFGPVMTPDEPELAHQADERASVESIIRNAKIYGASFGMLGLAGLEKQHPAVP